MDHTGKWCYVEMNTEPAPCAVSEAPNAPFRHPQREWLAGPLRDWAQGCIDTMLGSTAARGSTKERVRDDGTRIVRVEARTAITCAMDQPRFNASEFPSSCDRRFNESYCDKGRGNFQTYSIGVDSNPIVYIARFHCVRYAGHLVFSASKSERREEDRNVWALKMSPLEIQQAK